MGFCDGMEGMRWWREDEVDWRIVACGFDGAGATSIWDGVMELCSFEDRNVHLRRLRAGLGTSVYGWILGARPCSLCSGRDIEEPCASNATVTSCWRLMDAALVVRPHSCFVIR